MAKPYPKEFRDDVVAVARKGQAPLSQIAKDFGISEGSLANWMKQADIEDGKRPGLSEDERKQLEEDRARTEESAKLRDEDYQLAYAVDILRGLSAVAPKP